MSKNETGRGGGTPAAGEACEQPQQLQVSNSKAQPARQGRRLRHPHADRLDGGKLARVYPFRNRLPMMHRDGWTGPKASSSTPFAWFVWDAEHRGPAEIRRISWTRRP